ncbi:MAG: hypothetical protein IKI64_06580 [Clostridia bacterium]|nr:hypothetical protein [Clostridia bacterium]
MLREKAEYLRGLADGMQLDASGDKNAKLLRAIIDCIAEIADAVDDNTDEIDTIGEDIEEIFETMDVYDEVLFDDDDFDFCDCDDCEGDCDECDCGCESSIVCDECGTEIELDELLKCPKCHKPIFGEDDGDED